MRRGVTPINDEEIESWKRNENGDDEDDDDVDGDVERASEERSRNEKCGDGSRLNKHASATSLKKPPSIVVYQNQNMPRPSMDDCGPHSPANNGYLIKRSIEVPQTPVLARAPNARPGLTDEMVLGDDAFLPSPKRRPSRLSKHPPNSSISSRSPRGLSHGRSLSYRSSFSVGGGARDHWYGHGAGCTADAVVSPRSSREQHGDRFFVTSPAFPDKSRHHSRVYSSSSIPPRLSLDTEYSSGLSPRPVVHSSEIGRALG